jgi:hypothetical protein
MNGLAESWHTKAESNLVSKEDWLYTIVLMARKVEGIQSNGEPDEASMEPLGRLWDSLANGVYRHINTPKIHPNTYASVF